MWCNYFPGCVPLHLWDPSPAKTEAPLNVYYNLSAVQVSAPREWIWQLSLLYLTQRNLRSKSQSRGIHGSNIAYLHTTGAISFSPISHAPVTAHYYSKCHLPSHLCAFVHLAFLVGNVHLPDAEILFKFSSDVTVYAKPPPSDAVRNKRILLLCSAMFMLQYFWHQFTLHLSYLSVIYIKVHTHTQPPASHPKIHS